MKRSLIALAMLVSTTAIAQVKSATSREEFCQNRNQTDYFQQILLDESSKMGFTNVPGKFRTGLCWWHSQFQRNATYLTVYQPHKPKPSQEEAELIIQDIIHNYGIVEIPGYQNFSEFSRAYRTEIISALEGWLVSSSIGFGWLKGVMGSSEVSAAELRKNMDELYNQVINEKKVVFQVLQLEGVAAHAWLVMGMVKTSDGYKLYVQDSNYYSTQEINYREGMTSFRYPYWGKFVPYTYANGDLKSLARSQKKYCNDGTTSIDGRPRQSNFNQNQGG